ncbi:MAG: hypothetical protein LM573_04190 [Thermofilum sp.]|nr:hypothetical protein [Thermofilum sp.]
MSIARQLLEELRSDEGLRRALAEELLPEALRHRELRKAMLLALSREMATKEDIEELKSYVDARINDLKLYVDARFNDANRRISDLYGIVKASLVAIIATLISTILVPLILRILFHS